MNSLVKTGLTHFGTAAGAAVATAAFLATKSVDLYAIFDQANVVVADVTKLVALVTPILTAAYGVWRATTKNKIEDIQSDPRVKGIIASSSLADELGPKVQPSVAALPIAARNHVGE